MMSSSSRVPVSAIAPVLFTLTIFTSASLLFFVQPLFTRIVLPQIGGAAAVWTTAMLFFQSVLIAGYLYAHLLARYVAPALQLVIHLSLWTLALLFLPLAIPSDWSYDPAGSTVVQTLALYALGVGLPFAVLSANAPLIQSWYGQSGGPSADDPYFLYGASNFGSLIALLAFPLAAEPLFGTTQIGLGWAAGFWVLGAMLLACGGLAWRNHAAAAGSEAAEARTGAPAPGLGQIATWLFLAFIPSSMMLGVTSKISTDLGSFPLIWVIPLALYLLTFVLTFTNRPLLGDATLHLAFLGALAAAVVLVTKVAAPSLSWGASGLLVLAFFGIALTAHRRLYGLRPDKQHLTLFYVVMSVGGALGGLFNSIIAPIAFDDFHELRITVALAAFLLISGRWQGSARDLSLGVVVAFSAPVLVGLGATFPSALPAPLVATVIGAVLLAGLWMLRARGFGGAIAAILVLATVSYVERGDALLRDRSFFGSHMIADDEGLRLYSNGTTIHGAQRLAELSGRPAPLLYYFEDGPLGEILSSAKGQAARKVGVVGLGAGALACYRQPDQDWHFYEIDRMVDDIARNPAYFTYLSSCAGNAPTHLGDARIVLAQQPDQRFDVLVIDAYSSDAVPVHLTTREAMELYLDRLAPGGLLVYHISNRYYEIDRPLGRSAEALGISARIRRHGLAGETLEAGDHPTIGVVMARDEADLAEFSEDNGWMPLQSDGGRIWTDDYANLLSILK